jgi:amino acid transporter
MNAWSVAALGVGAMVGAGIFALLGQAALVARGSVWIAFVIGGVVAMFSGFSYARLSAKYPSASGIVAFYNAAFPSRIVSGALSLIFLLTLAVATALVAKSFGAYATRIFVGNEASHIWNNIFASAVIVALAIVNTIGSRAVGRAEVWLVGIKLVVLATLVVAGSVCFSTARLAAGGPIGLETILSAVGLTFFAYAGYGIMANASADVANPQREIPRAIYGAIGFVIVLYVCVSVVVLGNVTTEDLVKYADTAVAEAARPVLGQGGFLAVSIAALLATASAINANLFSSMNIALGLGREGELPHPFIASVRGKMTNGVLVALVGVLLLVNFLDLSVIGNIASAVFLLTYLAVFCAHWQLASETATRRWIIAVGFVLMATVFVMFEIGVMRTQPIALFLTVALVAGAVLCEALLRPKT